MHRCFAERLHHSRGRMKVRAQFFAQLRDVTGASETTFELSDGATVADLVEKLCGSHACSARSGTKIFSLGPGWNSSTDNMCSGRMRKSRSCRRCKAVDRQEFFTPRYHSGAAGSVWMVALSEGHALICSDWVAHASRVPGDCVSRIANFLKIVLARAQAASRDARYQS